MSIDGSIDRDFGDGTYRFRLAIGGLRELQDKTGKGPLELFRRCIAGTWFVDEPREIIRIGLVGGGLEPTKALALVRRYVDERPFSESALLAQEIIGAALFRPINDGEPEGNGAAVEAGTEAMSASPSTASTASEP